MRVLLLFVSMVAISASSFASGEKKTLDVVQSSATIGQGQTRTFQLGKKYFVHKLLIQAESFSSGDAYAQIIVNGDVKGTLYLPGRDPNYVITVAESTSSVEVSVITNQLTILDIKAVVTEEVEFPRESFPEIYSSKMARISNQILASVNRLEPLTDYRDYGTYLLPLKKVAAKALAYSEARGDLSFGGRPYYEAVVAQMEIDQEFLERSLEVDLMQQDAILLMSLKFKIKDLLN